MTDTSPKRLRELADAMRYACAEDFGRWETQEALLALAAEKETAPIVWVLKEELGAKETTCKGHLWFSDPKSYAWAPLYLAPQPIAEKEVQHPDDLAQPKPSPVLLTDEEISAIYRFPVMCNSLWARAIEAAALKKNGIWGEV